MEDRLGNIEIHYTKRIVRIRTNKALLDYLSKKGNGSLVIADHIRKTYRKKMGVPLRISRESLSLEILLHAWLDAFLRRVDWDGGRQGLGKRALGRPVRRVLRSTQMIDCGERAVDGNRIIFDLLVPFRGIIYGLLGRRA